MQANFNRYAISKSTYFFLFAVTIAASRAVHKCDALKLIHDRGPSLNIIAIAQAFEATEATHTVCGKTTNNKPVDQLNQAMTTLDPTAWGKSAARAGVYARTGLTAPVDGNTAKWPRTQTVDDQAVDSLAKSPRFATDSNDNIEDDYGNDMSPGGGVGPLHRRANYHDSLQAPTHIKEARETT